MKREIYCMITSGSSQQVVDGETILLEELTPFTNSVSTGLVYSTDGASIDRQGAEIPKNCPRNPDFNPSRLLGCVGCAFAWDNEKFIHSVNQIS